ncbi:MAG TPA: hypothetical protein ENK85_07335 [Saprospiraceae bacterium]|nr:hypothetical protein [Saprospiraceae bacterium]
MKGFLYIVFAWFLSLHFAQAQGAVYTLKGGLSLGMQKWDNQLGRRNPLTSYHIIAAIEELPEDPRFTIFAQAGYHARGTSMRTTLFSTGGQRFDQDFAIRFNNLALSVGAKKKLNVMGNLTPYYLLGVRGEYTLKTNLAQFQQYNTCYGIYPYDKKEFIKKFNYGAIFGGGFEFPFTDLLGGLIEFTVNPDFSRQYEQPAITGIINTCGSVGNGPTSTPQRSITNLTFEISLGLRFLHKVEYID